MSVAENHVLVGYGGKQASMRNSLILDEDGYLGRCQGRPLKPGHIQVMNVEETETDAPPATDPDAPRYDTPLAGAKEKTKDKSSAELAVELVSLGHQQLAYGNAETIRANAARIGEIYLTRTFVQIKQGYVEKPKGLKQIAFESGFWTQEELRKKRGGPKAEALRLKIGACTDFVEEISQLQYISQELGVEVRMTPKAHPELAGQGIEYSCWGYAKLIFSNYPKLIFRKDNTSCDKDRTTKLQ
jgi:hypothetical protein